MAKVPNSYILTQGGRSKSAVLSAAKTTLNNNTNAVKIADADIDDSIVTRAWAMPRATVSATKLQLYISPDDGTTMYFVDSVLMAAYTEANTTATPITEFPTITRDDPLYLPSGSSLWCGASVALAGGIVVNANIEDF